MKSIQSSASVAERGKWHSLQAAQFFHDENFHREISRLTVQDRLKHMTLHFAKYAGSMLSDSPQRDQRALLIDTFIIAISSANILSIDLEKVDFSSANPLSDAPFGERLCIAAGNLAAACEKLDHLEAFPFRETMAEWVVRIIADAKLEAENSQVNLWEATPKRLEEVKGKALFYDELRR